MPVVVERTLKDCVNTEDVCPFSLEPLCELDCVLVFEYEGKYYGCCARLWLEMLCLNTDGRYRHPIFRCELNEDDNYFAYEVCRAHFESKKGAGDPQQQEERAHRQKLLRQCTSKKLQSTVLRNAEGVITKIDIRPESPYKWVEIVEVQHKQGTGLRTNVQCGATVEYILFSRNPQDELKQMKLFV